jgi:hypothetical protein
MPSAIGRQEVIAALLTHSNLEWAARASRCGAQHGDSFAKKCVRQHRVMLPYVHNGDANRQDAGS